MDFKRIQEDYVTRNRLSSGCKISCELISQIERKESSILARILPQPLRKYVIGDTEKERKDVEELQERFLLLHLEYLKQNNC